MENTNVRQEEIRSRFFGELSLQLREKGIVSKRKGAKNLRRLTSSNMKQRGSRTRSERTSMRWKPRPLSPPRVLPPRMVTSSWPTLAVLC